MAVNRADLPVNIDTTYDNDPQDQSRADHQMHHDTVHAFVKTFEDTSLSDGYIWVYDGTGAIWRPEDPAAIEGQGFNWLGDWSSVTEYVAYDVVQYAGSCWVAVATNTNSAPPSVDWELAAQGMRLRGEWISTETYLIGDVVQSLGNSYVAIIVNANSQPPSNDWTLLAAAGAAGEAGAPGATGATGAKGDPGSPGPIAESLYVGVSGTAMTLYPSDYSVYDITLDNDCDITFDAVTTAVMPLTILLRQDESGGHTATFLSDIQWQDDTEPTWSSSPNMTDIISLFYINGYWYGTAMVGFPSPTITYDTLDVQVIGTMALGDDTTYYAMSPVGGSAGGSITGVSSGDLLLLFVTNERVDGVDPLLPTPQGLVNWELLDPTDGTFVYYTSASNRFRASLYGAWVASAPTPAPISFTFTTAQHGCSAILVRVVGTPPSALTLAKASVVKASGTSSSNTVTLAAAENSTNRPIAFAVCNRTYPIIAPRTNWTELIEIGHSVPTIALHVQWRSGAFETTASASWGANSVNGIMATELEQG